MSKTKSAAPKLQFTCHAPDAKQVNLAGTFNDWKSEATPMAKGDDGTWTVGLDLSAGRYEFKFVIDGEWCCEANGECMPCVPNDFGTMNRVLEVG